MGKRASEPASDSLELLLDTICNMFGGLILMAILIVMQTSASVSRLPQPTDTESEAIITARKLRNEAAQLQRRLNQVTAQSDRLEREAERDASPNAARLIQSHRDFAAAIGQAQERSQTAGLSADETRRQLEAIETDVAKLQTELTATTAEVNRLKQIDVRRPAGQVRLPHQKVAGTVPRYYVVRGKKVYRFGDGTVPPRWAGAPYDDEDCIVTPKSGLMRVALVRPRRGTGVDVPDAKGDGGEFEATLQAYDPDRYHVLFFVYKDSESYASFQSLKTIVLTKKYGYVVSPVEAAGDEPFAVVPTAQHETE